MKPRSDDDEGVVGRGRLTRAERLGLVVLLIAFAVFVFLRVS
jgi:hypothetical protein